MGSARWADNNEGCKSNGVEMEGRVDTQFR